MTKSVLAAICMMFITSIMSAQLPPPGYEREVKQYQEQQKTSFLDRDSLVMMDTTVLYDPDTYIETMTVIQNKMSVRDYCLHVLKFGNPELLSGGQAVEITDPNTYQKMTIKWNPATAKIDTIR